MLKFGNYWARVGVEPLQNASHLEERGRREHWLACVHSPAPPHPTPLYCFKSHFLCFLILQASWPHLEDKELVAALYRGDFKSLLEPEPCGLSGLGFPVHTRGPSYKAPTSRSGMWLQGDHQEPGSRLPSGKEQLVTHPVTVHLQGLTHASKEAWDFGGGGREEGSALKACCMPEARGRGREEALTPRSSTRASSWGQVKVAQPSKELPGSALPNRTLQNDRNTPSVLCEWVEALARGLV